MLIHADGGVGDEEPPVDDCVDDDADVIMMELSRGTGKTVRTEPRCQHPWRHALLSMLPHLHHHYLGDSDESWKFASPPSLLLHTSPGTDIPEVICPRKRACLTTPAPDNEIGESSAAGAARQSIPTPAIDTWDEIVEAMMEIAPTTLEGVDQRVTELDTTVRQRTEECRGRFVEVQARDFEGEEVLRFLNSDALEAHVRTLEAQVATLIAHTTSLQTQLTTALGRVTTLEARDPEPQDGPAEAGSSS
ncbi:hypothetical protein Tco_0589017 [Tanacetum coccineum]